MAEPVYKKITELDVLSGVLDGNETLPVVKSGKTYRRLWANFFGSGWITSLLAAFSAFKAPDADHADDADTVGGEDKATLHTANNLTGAVPLATIPAELTGKNAATATKLATARTIGGVSFDGTANINLPGVNTAGNQNTSGNAATATKLATARTIGGVAFDGSANINLPGVNTTGNQDTSGNAATAGGVDFINGEAGTYASVDIPADSSWIIPSGLYMIAQNTEMYLQVKTSGGSWVGDPPYFDYIATGQIQGLVLSDGVNYRFVNQGAATNTVYYRKLA